MKVRLIAACAALMVAGTVAAQDMKKDAMSKDAMKPMTTQECKDHMAVKKTDAMMKDPMMMKKDTMCADMMKKDGGMMKSDAMPKTDAMPKSDSGMTKSDTAAPKK